MSACDQEGAYHTDRGVCAGPACAVRYSSVLPRGLRLDRASQGPAFSAAFQRLAQSGVPGSLHFV